MQFDQKVPQLGSVIRPPQRPEHADLHLHVFQRTGASSSSSHLANRTLQSRSFPFRRSSVFVGQGAQVGRKLRPADMNTRGAMSGKSFIRQNGRRMKER